MTRKEEIITEQNKIFNELDELDSQRLKCEEQRDILVKKLCALAEELENLGLIHWRL